MTSKNNYSRRYCIGLEGIPSEEKESSDDVFHKVSVLFKESDIEVPEDIIDRAHRIGRVYEGKESGEKRQDVIVRFLNFRYRTVVYKKRKNLKGGVRARLDLTKRRYSLLKKAIEFVDGDDAINFVFADVNCRLKARLKNGTEQFFESLDELQKILESPLKSIEVSQ